MIVCVRVCARVCVRAAQMWREAAERLGSPSPSHFQSPGALPRSAAVAVAVALSDFGTKSDHSLGVAPWDAQSSGGSSTTAGLVSLTSSAAEMLAAMEGLVGSLEDAGASILAVRVMHALPFAVLKRDTELQRLAAIVRQVLVKVRVGS